MGIMLNKITKCTVLRLAYWIIGCYISVKSGYENDINEIGT